VKEHDDWNLATVRVGLRRDAVGEVKLVGRDECLLDEFARQLFAAAGTRDLERYNAKATDRPLPYIVIAVDGADESLDFPKSEFFSCMERLFAFGAAAGFRFVFVSRDADGTDSTAALVAALKLRSCAVLDLPPDTASAARTGKVADCRTGSAMPTGRFFASSWNGRRWMARKS
jgi:hypothetical protein